VASCGESSQEESDKEWRRGCANGLVLVRGGVWREGTSGDGRSARGEEVHSTSARCSTPCRPAEHARERTTETKQNKGGGLLGKSPGCLGEAIGALARSKKLIL
jgi:hypothetical protein